MAVDEPLADLTSFKIGGPARWTVSPADRGELADVVRRAARNHLKTRVLGRGANVLISDDGFDGVVIRLDAPAFRSLGVEGPVVSVGAGYDLLDLARICSDGGLSGLEGMAGIPATLGGAIRMNAGGRYGQIGDVVERVGLVDRYGEFRELGGDDLQFGYRTSSIGDGIVVDAVLRLTEGDASRTGARFREYWATKKASQPLGQRSAGCIFKNPPGHSAGALIDQAGLKGTSRGGARVSEKHANFIVAEPGAACADVLELIAHIRQVVRDRYGIDLELEIELW